MPPMFTEFFEWLLKATWQASLLALLILGVQWLLGRRLAPRWRHALWLILVVRLMLPVTPESALSLFNFIPYQRIAQPAVSPIGPAHAVVEPPTFPASLFENAERANATTESKVPPPSTRESQAVLESTPAASTPVRGASFWSHEGLFAIGALVWAMGVVVLVLRIILQNLAFAVKLKNAQPLADPVALEVFRECKTLFGLRSSVRLLRTSAVNCPALYGLLRPALLLPNHLLTAFNRQELRYMFLHELAHLKRHDMAIHWLATVLQVLHWFNPVLWYAFRRMAADRELACDELALARSAESSGRAYGETILKLLESCARPAVLPGAMGILEDRDQMTQRITMIASFRPRSRWSWLALGVVAALALITLTDARTATTPRQDVAANTSIVPRTGSIQVTGIVVNLEGRPIHPATITQDREWRDPAATVTNQPDGRFSINSAIGVETTLTILADGFELQKISLVSSNAMPIIQMRLTTKQFLRGRVLDAATHQSIQIFTLHIKDNEAIGSSSFSRQFTNGEFSIPLRTDIRREVEIHADGYMPIRHQVWNDLTNDGTVFQRDFTLEKHPGFFGKVLRPNGQPAARADVALATDSAKVILGKRHFMYRDLASMAKTVYAREDGSFWLPPAVGAHTLYAVDIDGFTAVKVEGAKSPFTLQLQQWGRIEGTLRIGTNVASDIRVGIREIRELLDYRATSLTLSPDVSYTSSDRQGRFILENIPPGEYKLSRTIPGKTKMCFYNDGPAIIVKSGEITQINYGGGGRFLKGRVVSSDPSHTIDWTTLEGRISLMTKLPMAVPPINLSTATEQYAWRRQYFESKEGQALARQHINYILNFESDGTVMAPDILPGEYLARINLFERNEENILRPFNPLFYLDKVVTVPAKVQDLDEIVDLGDFEINPANIRKPASSAQR